jgi:3-hydroxyisobutyrate dehydrogenase-like beta-hydroxyacid dehydrogenase
MLPGPREIREVVAGQSGLLRGAREGSLLADMSTSSPVLAWELVLSLTGNGVSACSMPRSAEETSGQ